MKKSIVALVFLMALQTSFGQKKPNVVLFFVDDLGWADVGYRNAKFHTPNIDQLRKDGMDFSRAYIATPTCSPSRASILTGREPVRFQMVRHVDDGNGIDFDDKGNSINDFSLWPNDPVQMPSINMLPLKEITYAERLKELGYYNFFLGKWHLGDARYFPTKQGFDEEYGVCNYGHPKNYYPPFFKDVNPLASFDKSDLYLETVLANKAIDFISNYKNDKPFMLSYFHYDVHGPQIGRKDWVEQYKKEGLKGKDAEYAAMISAVDESVGRVRKALIEKGIADNTVIIFTSDQGGFFSNAPLSGGKTGGNTLGEGGARVPFLMYYPGVTKANTSSAIPIQTTDVFPTLVDIAGGKVCKDKQVNGKSLLPIVKGEKFKEDRSLYFFRSYEDQYAAVIAGDWKLVKYHSGKFQLFNIKNDMSEQKDLITIELKQADKLKKDIAKWEKKAVPAFNKK
ncbi:sulfatase [Flavobacterium ovatum]|uniref:sulfatase n=1 Tax=Flavobacterium ovatum TaxID=1928857 RepID=UPI00344B0D7C